MLMHDPSQGIVIIHLGVVWRPANPIGTKYARLMLSERAVRVKSEQPASGLMIRGNSSSHGRKINLTSPEPTFGIPQPHH